MSSYNSVNTLIDPGVKLIVYLEYKKVDSILFKQIVRNLLYLTASKPDITYVMSFIPSIIRKLV